ncbi:MAG TPA: MMPL family transporter [Streptosporangiaceae bacterium]
MSHGSMPGRGSGGLPAGRIAKWVFLGIWLVILVAAIPLAGKLGGAEKNQNTVELPRGAQSTYVAGVADRFPDGKVSRGIVVYLSSSGITAADQAKAKADRDVFAAYAVEPVGSVVPSADGKALQVTVALSNNSKTLPADARKVRDQAQRALPPGLTAQLTGPAGNALDASDAQQHTAKAVPVVTGIVITVILLVIYRSPVLWLLPVLNAGAAFAVTDAVLYLLARFAGMPADTGNAEVVAVLVFGVSTDYALLLLARYREELRRNHDHHAAMAVALRRAAPAIIASAVTVSVSLLCLLTATMGFNYALAPAGAIGILCGLVAMTTLLPALLVILGRWVFWPRIPHAGEPDPLAQSLWTRLGSRIVRRPRTIWVGTVLVLGALAFGALGLRTGLDNEHMFVGHPGSLVGQQMLAEHYHAGQGNPVEVVAAPAAADQVLPAIRGVPDVAQVLSPDHSTDGQLIRVNAVLSVPSDSQAATTAVTRIRTAVGAIPGANAYVGGATAQSMDKAQAQAHDRRTVIPLVIIVVFAVLVVLLQALVGPLLLILTVLLSYFSALGISWLLFEHVFGFPAVDVQLMLVGFLFLVALGVDYNIFLVSRIRQEVARLGHRAGVLSGLAATGGVITSAGVVLAATFSSLGTAPQVAFIEIGVIVAVGVLIDTFLVRSVLVPALALDVGRAFWWPRRRSRDPVTEGTISYPAPVQR